MSDMVEDYVEHSEAYEFSPENILKKKKKFFSIV